MAERRLVLLEWVDSHKSNDWKDIELLADGCDHLHIRSIGWVIAENDDCITIVPHLSGEKNGNVRVYGCGEMTIPRVAILREEEICFE